MVAHIFMMAVEKKRWLGNDTFRSGVALCQTIPGATAMQTSAYVGLRTNGVGGAAASFVGFGLPAFFLMLVLSTLYARFHYLPAVGKSRGTYDLAPCEEKRQRTDCRCRVVQKAAVLG
jgi:chromate transporter